MRREASRFSRKNTVENRNAEPLYIRAIQGCSGGAVQPNFFTEDKLPKRFFGGAPHLVQKKLRSPSTKEVLCWKEPTTAQDNEEFMSHVGAMDPKLDPRFQAYTHLKPDHDAIYEVDMERTHEENV